MKKVVIIAGGGVFGYIPSYFISDVLGTEELHPRIDAIGGTSVGGILSLSYASGMNPAAVHESFELLVNQAFPRKWYTKWKIWGPKYSGRGLNKALLQILGEARLHEMKIPVVVPTVDFEHNKPKVWDNFEGGTDAWTPAWEVARMTASAPTYFPPHNGHVDGGILSNIPVLETVTALKHKKGWRFEDMAVLVLGTGKKALRAHPQKETEKWGATKWLPPMLDYLTFANEQASIFVAKQLGLGSLTIYNPVQLRSAWGMDDPSLLGELEKQCGEYVSSAKTVIRTFLAK